MEALGYIIGLAICYGVGFGLTSWINKKWNLNINPIVQGGIHMLLGIFIGAAVTGAWAFYVFKQNK